MADIDAKTWLESVTLDEDNMVSNSNTDVATQQSIKAYSDFNLTQANAYTDSEISALTFASETYVDMGDATTLANANTYTDTQINTYGSSGNLATALFDYHDVVINSALGIQLQTPRWDFAAVTPAVTAAGSLTAPDWVKFTDNGGGSNGLWTLGFSPTSVEEILGTVTMNDNRISGTDVYPALIWSAPTTGTGDQRVSWAIEYMWPVTGGSIVNSTIIASNVSNPAGNPLIGQQIYVTALPPITPPATELNAVYVRIFRDATGVYFTDNYPNDALFGALVFFFPVNRIGSDSIL